MLAMWEWQEGVPAVALAQTVRDLRGRPVDDLRSDDDLDAWLASQEDRVPRLAPGERDVGAWGSLREGIAAALPPPPAGAPPPPPRGRGSRPRPARSSTSTPAPARSSRSCATAAASTGPPARRAR